MLCIVCPSIAHTADETIPSAADRGGDAAFCQIVLDTRHSKVQHGAVWCVRRQIQCEITFALGLLLDSSSATASASSGQNDAEHLLQVSTSR